MTQVTDIILERINRLEDSTNARFTRLDEKISVLLEFKWKIVGGTVLASLILTAVGQVMSHMLK